MNKVNAPIEQRSIRVFISSTFRDMQEEREVLVKYIFPKLRKICEDRNVTWCEVDLRWGVTDEQKAEGNVLPICLAILDKCSHFIGLLGERYGCVLDEIPKSVIKQYPWVKNYLHHSVTEMEIVHGALRKKGERKHAFFYLRDPAYIKTFPEQDYRETPAQEDIETFGYVEAKRRAEGRNEKLSSLKTRIKASDFPVEDNYPNPKALGELILQDFTAVIDKLYPKDLVVDTLDRDSAEHEAFAANREKVYISRENYFKRLDKHIRGDGPPLVILGESGCGKSALLANWTKRFCSINATDLIILHFIGSTPYSADWTNMLRRIMGKLKRNFDIGEEIPDHPDKLCSAFSKWLCMAAAKGRVVLILDALNQLEDRDGAPDLVWLPPSIPSNIRIVLSTLPGRSLNEINKRGWPIMKVSLLDHDERVRLIEKYLAQYTKHLEIDQKERIANGPTANPLYLRVLLEELRLWGEHYTLNRQIEHYMAAETIDELYDKVLERCERDYEDNHPGLVRQTLSLLWAARRGLSEAELLELLGSNEEPLPQAYWSPLYLSLEQSLVDRSGLIGFAHDYLRQAVLRKYLPTKQDQNAFHVQIADYFNSREISPRMIDELPWQLTQAEAWQRLIDLLADISFFNVSWKANKFNVLSYWAQVECNSSFRISKTYRQVIDKPSNYLAENDWSIAEFLRATGNSQDAMILWQHIIDLNRELGNFNLLQRALKNLALILRDNGNLDEAIRLLKEEEQICRQIANLDGLAVSLTGQALILYDRSDLNGALTLLKEGELIDRQQNNPEALATSLGNQALILRSQGNLDAAITLYKEQEQICRQLGKQDSLASSLTGQALILYDRSDLNGALTLLKEGELICRKEGSLDSLAGSLADQAVILYDRRDLKGALTLLKEGELICRQINNPYGLQKSLGHMAYMLMDSGDLNGALELLKEREMICRQTDNPDGLHASLTDHAHILKELGDLRGALELLKEKEMICRSIGDYDGLTVSLYNQGHIYLALNNANDAEASYLLALEIAEELHQKGQKGFDLLINLAINHNRIGNLYIRLKKHTQAIYHYQQALKVREELYKMVPNNAHISHDLALSYKMVLECLYTINNISEFNYYSEACRAFLDDIRRSNLPFDYVMKSLFVALIDNKEKEKYRLQCLLLPSSAHPEANPERKSRLNIEFQHRMRKWKALPLWRRMITKKPTRNK